MPLPPVVEPAPLPPAPDAWIGDASGDGVVTVVVVRPGEWRSGASVVGARGAPGEVEVVGAEEEEEEDEEDEEAAAAAAAAAVAGAEAGTDRTGVAVSVDGEAVAAAAGSAAAGVVALPPTARVDGMPPLPPLPPPPPLPPAGLT